MQLIDGAKSEVSAGASPPCQTSSQWRILVVDDDDSLRRLNAMVLISAGYHVDTAEDGASAWNMLQPGSYHLLVTDNEMPNLSGLELLKKVHDARIALKVVLASGSCLDEVFRQSPELTPSVTLPKPYTNAQLLGAVRKVLGGSSVK